MRDEKEERKKQARSNKQTRQSNTAHPMQSPFLEKMSYLGYMRMQIEVLRMHVVTESTHCRCVQRKFVVLLNERQERMKTLFYHARLERLKAPHVLMHA